MDVVTLILLTTSFGEISQQKTTNAVNNGLFAVFSGMQGRYDRNSSRFFPSAVLMFTGGRENDQHPSLIVPTSSLAQINIMLGPYNI